MTQVFIVMHTRDFERPTNLPPSEKLIGIYSSESAAEAAIRRARTRQGFAEYPDGFRVDKYVINEDRIPHGFVST